MTDVVSKERKTKSSSHLVNFSLLSADVHNANGKIDLSQYTQHPVLFAPAIWTARKENFPWNISLSGFNVGTSHDSLSNQFLCPVTTNGTFGTSIKGESRNVAVCGHADMTALEFFLNTSTIRSLVMISQCLATVLIDSFPIFEKHKEPPIKVEQVKTAIGPSLIQRSLGSVSESATPITSGVQIRNTLNLLGRW